MTGSRRSWTTSALPSARPMGCPDDRSPHCWPACQVGKESIFVFDEYGPVRMIRSQEWKLVWRYPAGAHELYNIAEDPEERVNLFIQPGHADRIRILRRELDDWFAKYVDPQTDGSSLAVIGYGQRDRATQADAFDYRPRK